MSGQPERPRTQAVEQPLTRSLGNLEGTHDEDAIIGEILEGDANEPVSRGTVREAFRHVLAESYQGPLPRPQDLEHYARVIPNGAERIMAMAERESRRIVITGKPASRT